LWVLHRPWEFVSLDKICPKTMEIEHEIAVWTMVCVMFLTFLQSISQNWQLHWSSYQVSFQLDWLSICNLMISSKTCIYLESNIFLHILLFNKQFMRGTFLLVKVVAFYLFVLKCKIATIFGIASVYFITCVYYVTTTNYFIILQFTSQVHFASHYILVFLKSRATIYLGSFSLYNILGQCLLNTHVNIVAFLLLLGKIL
jgi:hypothetical protein